MSKILITGNGFDLFHHLPTKYGHFMAVMKTIEELNIKDEITFNDLYGKYFKSEFGKEYELINECYDINKITFNINSIIVIKEDIKINKWYSHFKNILEIETWIDFENEIEKLLSDISTIFNALKINPNIYNYYRKDKINVYNDLTCFGFIKEIRDTEVELKKEFLNDYDRTVKEKVILKDLAVSIEDFISLFNKYLTDIIYLFYPTNIKKYSISFHLMNEIYTFNYTPTLEKLHKVDESKITYLHGKSNENNAFQNLILGVSEIPIEIKKHKMYDFAKYYQKINKSSNPNFIKISEGRVKGLDETIFYIIGHSLDESDKEYVLDLFKFLHHDLEKRSKICVFYYNSFDRETKIKNLLSIIDKEIIVDLNKEKRLFFTQLSIENINKEFEKSTYKRGSQVYIS